MAGPPATRPRSAEGPHRDEAKVSEPPNHQAKGTGGLPPPAQGQWRASPTRPRAAEGPLLLNNVVQKLIYEPAPSQLWQVQEEEIHPLEHFQLGCRSWHFLGSQRAVSWADGLFLQTLTVEFCVLVYAAYAARI